MIQAIVAVLPVPVAPSMRLEALAGVEALGELRDRLRLVARGLIRVGCRELRHFGEG